MFNKDNIQKQINNREDNKIKKEEYINHKNNNQIGDHNLTKNKDISNNILFDNIELPQNDNDLNKKVSPINPTYTKNRTEPGMAL